jgi:hypothetical protein
MLQRSLILVSVSALALGGCASSNLDLIPVPAPDGPMKFSDQDGAILQVQVQNQGLTPVESSPVAIEFFLQKITVKSAIQDGGALQPGESSRVLEFEIPKECLEGGCEFQVSVDPRCVLTDENRSNNLAHGRCEGQIASTYTHSHGTARPRVQ